MTVKWTLSSITLQWSGHCHLLHYSEVDIVIY